MISGTGRVRKGREDRNWKSGWIKEGQAGGGLTPGRSIAMLERQECGNEPRVSRRVGKAYWAEAHHCKSHFGVNARGNRAMSEFVKLTTVAEVPPGEAREFEVEGRVIAVFNLHDRFVAVDGVCPHQGGRWPMGRWNRAWSPAPGMVGDSISTPGLAPTRAAPPSRCFPSRWKATRF